MVAKSKFQYTKPSSKYTITATQEGFEIHSNSISINPDYQSYNISKPKLGGIAGTVFFDENDNEIYESGEEMSNVQVHLIYEKTNVERHKDNFM